MRMIYKIETTIVLILLLFSTQEIVFSGESFNLCNLTTQLPQNAYFDDGLGWIKTAYLTGNKNPEIVLFYYIPITTFQNGYPLPQIAVFQKSNLGHVKIWQSQNTTHDGYFNWDPKIGPIKDIQKDGRDEILFQYMMGRFNLLSIYTWDTVQNTLVYIPIIRRMDQKNTEILCTEGYYYKDLNGDGIDEIIAGHDVHHYENTWDYYKWVGKSFRIANFEFSEFHNDEIKMWDEIVYSLDSPATIGDICIYAEPLIQCYIYQKKYSKAKEVCQFLIYKSRIEGHDRIWDKCYQFLGDIEMDLGNKEKAIKYYRKADEYAHWDEKNRSGEDIENGIQEFIKDYYLERGLEVKN